jgi:predicted GIY-YIG superfamily endonuclease
MTTFDPPLGSAPTAADQYLSERIETDADTTPTAARTPGCYVLRCCKPQTRSVEAHTRRWLDVTGHEHAPPYLDSVAAAKRLYYVGASERDVYDRLTDHASGEHRQVAFLKVYPPASIERVEPTDADRALERESALETRLSNAWPDAFIHQN